MAERVYKQKVPQIAIQPWMEKEIEDRTNRCNEWTSIYILYNYSSTASTNMKATLNLVTLNWNVSFRKHFTVFWVMRVALPNCTPHVYVGGTCIVYNEI